MKKFMKAIAFATVMCMLLSTAAFAAETDGSAEWGTGATVEVVINAGAANAEKQLALIVSTAESADQIATGNIEDVQQVALDENGSKAITLGTGDAAEVNVFYGYAGRGAAGMLELAAQSAEPGDTVIISNVEILDEAAIEELSKVDGNEIVTTDTDYAGVIMFEIAINAEEKTVKDMIWSIRHKGEKGVSYVKADKDIFSVLDGNVRYALAFSNGNRSTGEAAIAEVEVTDLEAIVLLSDDTEIFSEEVPFDQLEENQQTTATE